jgi:hypothetical protein
MDAFTDWPILGAVALTSLLGVVVRSPWSSPASLGLAALHALESLGYATGFFLLNVATGGLVVLAVPRLEGSGVSLYAVSDASLLALSLFQGLVFAAWRAGPRAADAPAPSVRPEPSGSRA